MKQLREWLYRYKPPSLDAPSSEKKRPLGWNGFDLFESCRGFHQKRSNSWEGLQGLTVAEKRVKIQAARRKS